MCKKSTKPCPSCNNPIKNKNFKASLKKCLDCGKICCPLCQFTDVCNDCYVKSTRITNVNDYLNDKYTNSTHQGVF